MAELLSLYGLHWSIASGIGPVLGGFLNDTIGPRFIWIGGAWFPLVGAFVFLLRKRWRKKTIALLLLKFRILNEF